MYQKFALFSAACFITVFAVAQITKPVAAAAGKRVYNFTSINPKLQYVFIENKTTPPPHPQEGDDVMMHMIALCNNRIMYNSSQLNKGKPGAFSLTKPAFKGDINEALVLMTPGDSIICMVDAQSLFEFSKKKMPDYIKPGDKVQYNIRLVSIIPKEQLQKEREAAMQKALQQLPVQNTDDEALKTYFSSKNITPIKTVSGLYYSIQQEGSGPQAKPGDMVTINYRGTLPDGTVFDSNLDSAFKHVQPLNFVLGTGRVIKGWEEGIAYLKAGSKAVFYIPSALAYGSQSRPGNAANPKGIPANAVLIFDVELVAVKPPGSN